MGGGDREGCCSVQWLGYLHHLGRRTIRVFAEFCRLFHPWCQYIGDWSREEFAISRAEVELCITPGPETSLDEDKLLLQTESSNSWTEAEHHGKDRSYRIIYICLRSRPIDPKVVR